MSHVASSDRICVLGAGAAGLSLAYELEKHGYKHVTVLEQADRVGGKCCTVQVDGRLHDMGAVGGTPWLYRDFRKLAKEVGVDHAWAPLEKVYSLRSSDPKTLHTLREKIALVGEALRYVGLHTLIWKGARVSGIHHPEHELYQSWENLVKQHRLEKLSQRLRNSRIGFGYGFDHDIPALYPITCTNPKGVFGSLAGTGLYFWPGGTQTVWERVGEKLGDVRTNVQVKKIERHEDGVRLLLQNGKSLDFDVLVIAFNPAHALHILDVSDEERKLFGQIETLDYRSVACRVDGIDEGRLGVGFVEDNLVPEHIGRPLLWTKQHKDQNVFIFYAYGNEGVGDEDMFRNVQEDVERLGGNVVGDALEVKRWEYFPHVKKAALEDGFYDRMDALQGEKRTFYTGSYLTFEMVPFALANGRKVARLMMNSAR